MRAIVGVSVRIGFSQSKGRVPGTGSSGGGGGDIPGPPGATSFTVTWLPDAQNTGNQMKIEYGIDGGITFPYCKYISDATLLTGTVSSLASDEYSIRLKVVTGGVEGMPGVTLVRQSA